MKRLGVILIALGLVALVAWGSVQFAGDKVVTEVRKISTPVVKVTPPEGGEPVEVRKYTVTISNTGGEREMDYCAGGFTEMVNYAGLEGRRLLSAHNNCGGDVILPMEVGDHVIIEGEREYVITELRDTGKSIDTSAVNDMNGEVLLQSCYYEGSSMKFAALTPVG